MSKRRFTSNKKTVSCSLKYLTVPDRWGLTHNQLSANQKSVGSPWTSNLDNSKLTVDMKLQIDTCHNIGLI